MRGRKFHFFPLRIRWQFPKLHLKSHWDAWPLWKEVYSYRLTHFVFQVRTWWYMWRGLNSVQSDQTDVVRYYVIIGHVFWRIKAMLKQHFLSFQQQSIDVSLKAKLSERKGRNSSLYRSRLCRNKSNQSVCSCFSSLCRNYSLQTLQTWFDKAAVLPCLMARVQN